MKQKLATRDRGKYKVEGHTVIMDPAEAMREMAKNHTVAVDLETTGFSPWRNNIAMMQFYGAETKTLSIIQIRDGVIPPPIVKFFDDKPKNLVGHNLVAFDIMFLYTHGLNWKKHTIYDTLVGETLITPMGRRDVSKSLKASLKRRLGIEVDKNIEHSQWGTDKLSLEQVTYACQDVLHLPGLMLEQIGKAKKSNEYNALQMEMQLVPHVAQMTINGLPLRRDVLEQYIQDQYQAIEKSEKYLRRRFGRDINLNSHVQLKKALWDAGLEVESTGVEVLIPLSQVVSGEHYKLVMAILNYKHGAQRIKMYNEHWMDQHIVADWCHPRFWQVGTDTTRFSCSDPNFQQIPKDSRYLIGNIPGYKIVSADYSQIEIRIAAYYANDAILIAALEKEDIHRSIAAEIYGVPESKVTPDQRRHAKALSFGLLFGGSWATIFNHARMSGSSMTEQESKVLTNRFFARFLGLKAMRNKAYKMADAPGPVVIRLPNGTRRILVGYNKRHTVILNTIVQGSASVGIKYGMLEAAKRGLFKYMGSTVHDELVAAVPNREAKEYGRELEDSMITGMAAVIDTAIRVETKIADCWQA